MFNFLTLQNCKGMFRGLGKSENAHMKIKLSVVLPLSVLRC